MRRPSFYARPKNFLSPYAGIVLPGSVSYVSMALIRSTGTAPFLRRAVAGRESVTGLPGDHGV